MVNIKINDVPISVEEGTTILEACREAKMIVPTLCYLKDINEIGACRVCVVEVKGIHHLVTSCNNQVQEADSLTAQLLLPYLCSKWKLPASESCQRP